MPKFGISLFTIYALLIVTLPSAALAQPLRDDPPLAAANVLTAPVLPSNTNAAGGANASNAVDLKKVFDEETRKFKLDSAAFDPIKVELQKNRQQVQKKGWSKKDTAFIVVFAVGIAVLVVLLAKYGKECAETNQPNCNIGLDDNCYCERFEEDNSRPSGAR